MAASFPLIRDWWAMTETKNRHGLLVPIYRLRMQAVQRHRRMAAAAVAASDVAEYHLAAAVFRSL